MNNRNQGYLCEFPMKKQRKVKLLKLWTAATAVVMKVSGGVTQSGLHGLEGDWRKTLLTLIVLNYYSRQT